jgi:hypothetical protein
MMAGSMVMMFGGLVMVFRSLFGHGLSSIFKFEVTSGPEVKSAPVLLMRGK